jgi:hypothetical protein
MEHRKTGAKKIQSEGPLHKAYCGSLFLPWPTYKEETRDDGTRVSKMQEHTPRQACAYTITVTPTGRTWDLRFRSRILRQGSVTLPRNCAQVLPLSPTHMAFFSILLSW